MAYVKEDWWLTDREGRRIGWLWPEDFEAILESFFGKYWVMEFCRRFGYNRSQIDRYRRGSAPIPVMLAQLVQILQTLKNHNIPLSEIEAPWLPYVEGSNGRATVEGNELAPALPKQLEEPKRLGRPRKKTGGRPKGSA